MGKLIPAVSAWAGPPPPAAYEKLVLGELREAEARALEVLRGSRKGPAPYWTRARVVAAIRAWAAAHGAPPTYSAWPKACPQRTHPAASTAYKVFGTWGAAIEAAGYDRPRRGVAAWVVRAPHRTQRLTEEEVAAIRADTRPLAAIAADYRLSKTYICNIRRGRYPSSKRGARRRGVGPLAV